jgi:transcriptional regulator with XRE-family HTH domain
MLATHSPPRIQLATQCLIYGAAWAKNRVHSRNRLLGRVAMPKKLSPVEQEVRHYSVVLRQIIQAAGMSVSEMERRLGQGPKSLRRVFAGVVDLKFKHVITVLHELDMAPEKFFEIAAAQARRKRRRLPAAELVKAFEAMGYRGDFVPLDEDDEPPPPEGFDRLVENTVRRVVARLERERAAQPAPEPKDQRVGDRGTGGAGIGSGSSGD